MAHRRELLQAAYRAVRLACRVGASLQPSIAAHAASSAIAKVDASPVTVADWSVQVVVTLTLEASAVVPSPLLLVGEESPEWLETAAAAPVLDNVRAACCCGDSTSVSACVRVCVRCMVLGACHCCVL